MAYDVKMRTKVLETREKYGLTIEEVSKRFDVGVATVNRWIKRKEIKIRQRKMALSREVLLKDVEKYKDDYQRERAVRLGVSEFQVQYALKKYGISYKKKLYSSKGERRRED